MDNQCLVAPDSNIVNIQLMSSSIFLIIQVALLAQFSYWSLLLLLGDTINWVLQCLKVGSYWLFSQWLLAQFYEQVIQGTYLCTKILL